MGQCYRPMIFKEKSLVSCFVSQIWNGNYQRIANRGHSNTLEQHEDVLWISNFMIITKFHIRKVISIESLWSYPCIAIIP